MEQSSWTPLAVERRWDGEERAFLGRRHYRLCKAQISARLLPAVASDELLGHPADSKRSNYAHSSTKNKPTGLSVGEGASPFVFKMAAAMVTVK